MNQAARDDDDDRAALRMRWRALRSMLREAVRHRGSPASGALLATLLVAGLTTADRARESSLDDTHAALGVVERASLDLRFRMRPPIAASGEVVLVELDSKTAARAPDLFRRRKLFADLVGALSEAKPSVVVLDLLFESPEDPLPLDLLGALRDVVPDLPDDGPPDRVRALLERVFDEVRGDEILAEALRTAAPTILALHVGRSEGRPLDEVDLSRAHYPIVLPGSRMPFLGRTGAGSLPAFVHAAHRQGLASHDEDEDGESRTLPGGISTGDDVAMPLAVAAVGLHRREVDGLAFSGRDGSVRVGARAFPLDDGKLLLNFHRHYPSVDRVSAVDVLSGDVPRARLEGKIVVVGITSLHEYDRVTTPFGPGVPGAELHVTAIENLLADDFLRRTSPGVDFVLSLLAGLAVVLLFVRRERMRPAALLALALALVATTIGLVFSAFALVHWWVPAIAPLCTQAAALVTGLVLSYLDDGLERQKLRRAFSRYLSHELMDEMLRAPERVSLSGERRVLSVLFSDIRDFTTLAEGIAPEALAALLTRYFTPMTRAVLSANGYLDKYIGDAIMAVFGAPVFHDDHARDACRAALAMHRALGALKAELAPTGVRLDIGIGLNTGEMVVGNMGSEERFDYTVLGDAVNLASRIEGLTKEYGVFCLVGSDTVLRAGSEFRFRSVDLVRVKGKERAVEVFELLGDGAHSIVELRALDVWSTALAHFRDGDVGKAGARFMDFQEQNPDDPVVAIYLERLRTASTNPGARVDRVTTFTKK